MERTESTDTRISAYLTYSAVAELERRAQVIHRELNSGESAQHLTDVGQVLSAVVSNGRFFSSDFPALNVCDWVTWTTLVSLAVEAIEQTVELAAQLPTGYMLRYCVNRNLRLLQQLFERTQAYLRELVQTQRVVLLRAA